MPIRLVVTDMDNTLYSWVDYIVPCLEAMVESLCRSTGFPRIRVVQSLKKVYEQYQSNEYPFAIQESGIFSEFSGDFHSFQKLVIDPAREAFASARGRYLVPYRGVVEGLRELREMKVKVAALTDAPRNPAELRAKRMKLDELLDGIYTLPGFPFPQSGIDPKIQQREVAGEYRCACPVVELPRDFEKPDPRGLAKVCADLGVDPKETLVVGDSLTKDVGAARALGALDAWAEYGTYVSAEYRERLDVISAPSATRRHLQQGDGAEPTYRLSNFMQVVQIVKSQRAAVSAVA